MGRSLVGSDPSNGYNNCADDFAAARSAAGTNVVTRWAKGLARGSAVIDIGAGTGDPLTRILIGNALRVWAVEPAPRLRQMFLASFPQVPCDDHPVEASSFFDREFDAVLMIGVIFLLPAKLQSAIIKRIGAVLPPGGHFLLSAPIVEARWTDTITGRTNQSLGLQGYARAFQTAGFELESTTTDRGGSHYFLAVRTGAV